MSEFKRPPRRPDIEAEITARPTSEGGRKSPMFSNYRPNHDFGVEGMLNDALHEYPQNGSIAPGETGKANLWFLAPEYQVGRLFIDMEFTVQEGGRLVGKGKITKVLNDSLQKRI
jgi:elongation factor Tu